MCTSESHSLYMQVHTSFLASVYCKESLVWLKARDCCYTLDTGLSLELPLDILLLPVSWRACGFESAGPAPSRAPEFDR